MSYCFGGELEMTITADEFFGKDLKVYDTKMTETIQQLKGDIAVLQEKLQKFEEIEKEPRMNLQQEGEYAVVSYHDKVYYRLGNKTTFSWYIKKNRDDNHHVYYLSPNLVMVEDAETERLLEGIYYNHIQVKKEKEQRVKELVKESVKWCEEHPDKDPLDWLKPQTPEQVSDGLKEAFREAVKQGVVSSSNKPQNLYDLIADCMVKYNSTVYPELICDILDAVEEWLPDDDPHDGKEYQYRVGWNACLKFMRANLR
jgi:hypothetical protein